MTRPRTIRIIKFAGAASLIALSAACASNDRRYYSDYQSGYGTVPTYGSAYDTRQDDLYYNDGYQDASYRSGGIDAARIAHRQYHEGRAERLDGNCESVVYIERGETLSDIAEYCDVPVAALVRANNIHNVRNVAAGQSLRVPNVKGNVYEGSRQYRYAYHDSRYRNASYRDDYVAANWIEDYEGRDSYRIRRGDTLAEIAWRFDIPLRTLYQLNPGVHPRQLQVGQRIYLPEYANTTPRQRDKRDYVYYEDEPPLISITPARGPRDGKIRVLGDNFRQGEKVTVYFGDNQNNLTKLKIVETDGDGRINEVVTLPDTYDRNEAYFAFRPRDRDDYIMSEAYAVDVDRRDRTVISRNDRNDRYDNSIYNDARIVATESSVYWGDKITLRAEGFPPNTPVAIYGGPNRNALEKVSEIRSGPRGRFNADVNVPESGRNGEVVYVAAIEDGPRTIVSERIRVMDPDGRYDRGYSGASFDDGYIDRNAKLDARGYDKPALTPTRLERGVNTNRGLFSRFRRDDSYVADGKVRLASGGASSIVGVLTNEGENCPTLRDDAGNLYTLLGDLEGFDDGDRVLVKGSVGADDRICGQAEAVHIYSVKDAPW